MTKIASKTFSGSSKVFDGTLASAIRELAQFQSATLAKTLSDITDSSTGTSGGDTAAVVTIPAAFTSAGTDAAPKAGFETALGTHKNALTVLLTAAKVIADAITIDAITISTGGTIATAGTVPAMTKSVTATAGSGAACLGATSARALMTLYKNELTAAVNYVNEIAVAVGLTPITNSVGGDGGFDRVFAVLSTDTGTAATAPQAAALGTISKAAADTYLTASANAIATMAAKLNAATDSARVVTPTVVAVA